MSKIFIILIYYIKIRVEQFYYMKQLIEIKVNNAQ